MSSSNADILRLEGTVDLVGAATSVLFNPLSAKAVAVA
jgi:hypothetical protein